MKTLILSATLLSLAFTGNVKAQTSKTYTPEINFYMDKVLNDTLVVYKDRTQLTKDVYAKPKVNANIQKDYDDLARDNQILITDANYLNKIKTQYRNSQPQVSEE